MSNNWVKVSKFASRWNKFKTVNLLVKSDCHVSIPNGTMVIFHRLNPFFRFMTLGSTHSLTEMCTRDISWGVKAAGV